MIGESGITRDDLVRAIEEERARLRQTLARIHQAEVAGPVLADISFWERELLARVTGQSVAGEPKTIYRRLLAWLRNVPDEQLNQPTSRGRPLWREIASVTYEHYWEHTEALRLSLLRRRHRSFA